MAIQFSAAVTHIATKTQVAEIQIAKEDTFHNVMSKIAKATAENSRFYKVPVLNQMLSCKQGDFEIVWYYNLKSTDKNAPTTIEGLKELIKGQDKPPEYTAPSPVPYMIVSGISAGTASSTGFNNTDDAGSEVGPTVFTLTKFSDIFPYGGKPYDIFLNVLRLEAPTKASPDKSDMKV